MTDPACPESWGREPELRRLEAEFADQVAFTYVMGGLARSFDAPLHELRRWLDVGAQTGMPVDARGWLDAPPASSYPVCLAVKAAAEQRLGGPYLRRAREAFAVGRARLDTPDALIALAAEVPGLKVERFRIDLASNAIVEAFGTDLERARAAPWPRVEVEGEVASDVRAAVLAAGATPGPAPGVEEALRRFGRLAVPEVAAVCGLPGPRAPAELWRLTLDWRAREAAPGLWALA